MRILEGKNYWAGVEEECLMALSTISTKEDIMKICRETNENLLVLLQPLTSDRAKKLGTFIANEVKAIDTKLDALEKNFNPLDLGAILKQYEGIQEGVQGAGKLNFCKASKAICALIKYCISRVVLYLHKDRVEHKAKAVLEEFKEICERIGVDAAVLLRNKLIELLERLYDGDVEKKWGDDIEKLAQEAGTLSGWCSVSDKSIRLLDALCMNARQLKTAYNENMKAQKNATDGISDLKSDEEARALRDLSKETISTIQEMPKIKLGEVDFEEILSKRKSDTPRS